MPATAVMAGNLDAVLHDGQKPSSRPPLCQFCSRLGPAS